MLPSPKVCCSFLPPVDLDKKDVHLEEVLRDEAMMAQFLLDINEASGTPL
jgi:hypothetical protein